jgi:hypothetical protein
MAHSATYAAENIDSLHAEVSGDLDKAAGVALHAHARNHPQGGADVSTSLPMSHTGLSRHPNLSVST